MTIATDLTPSLADGTKLRTQRLLRRVAADPSLALDDRRCRKPGFCLGYFDLCDDLALRWTPEVLEQPDQALRHARAGVELAEKTGDPHLVHLAYCNVSKLPDTCLAVGGTRDAIETGVRKT